LKGFRSGLEQTVAAQITKENHALRYETTKIQWVDFSIRSYTPDFILDNGIILEVKGFWATADRRKHTEIRKQHDTLDIRLVFENSKRKIRKGSKTTYAAWCEKRDILYCDRVIPITWLQERLVSMPPNIITVERTKEDDIFR